MINTSAQLIAYLPSAQSAATLNSRVNTFEPSAATALSPLGVANASLSAPFAIVSAPYAFPLAAVENAILLAAFSNETPPSKPATAIESPLTITSTLAVSPALTVMSAISHVIVPFCTTGVVVAARLVDV
jgi:hypothetical protein